MSGTNNNLAYISATEVARLIKKGEITSVEVTQLAIDRANATQGTLNAFITICEDQAIDAARSSDSAVSNGEKLGPLQGVPFTVKDLINTQGVRTPMGALIFDENFPKSHAEILFQDSTYACCGNFLFGFFLALLLNYLC